MYKKDERKKVLIAVLNQGTNSAGLETQLIQWMLPLMETYNMTFQPSKYSYRPISNNRNMIVRDFLNGGYDILIMIDDDNPPLSNIFELIPLNKDIIAAVTPGRDDRGIYWHVYDFSENYPEKIEYKRVPAERRKGLQQVGAVSTGCIIIQRHVLETLERPFEDLFDEDGILISNDDMHFCHKAKQAGFEVWAHFDYICSHYKTVDLLQMLRLIQAQANAAPKIKTINLQGIKDTRLIQKMLKKSG